MTSQLASFQDGFARALLARDERQPPSPWQAQPAFAVYRNTVLKGCIDALEANYPSVARLVGREWFRSAALLYVRAQPPHNGALLDYGRTFARFLRGFEPAEDLPYLAGVASLDRFWTEAHVAADAPPLNAAQLAALEPECLMQCRLAPHPAARWAWFEGQPIYSIWQRNRQADDEARELPWQSEGVLITRPDEAVGWLPAGQADCAFLDACAQQRPLGDAIETALQADPQADLGALLARLLQAGALSKPLPATKGAMP